MTREINLSDLNSSLIMGLQLVVQDTVPLHVTQCERIKLEPDGTDAQLVTY